MREECLKVWGWDETEPPDGKMTNLTSHPPNWFRYESPNSAAELYLAERNMPSGMYKVHVRTQARVVIFEVKQWLETRVSSREIG